MTPPVSLFAPRPRLHRGFTMVELIVVIVILGILASVAIVGYQQVVARSQDARTEETVRGVLKEAQALAAFRHTGVFVDADMTEAIGDLPSAAAPGVTAAFAGVKFGPVACTTPNSQPFLVVGGANLYGTSNRCSMPSATASETDVSWALSDTGRIAAVALRSPSGAVAYGRASAFGHLETVVVDDDPAHGGGALDPDSWPTELPGDDNGDGDLDEEGGPSTPDDPGPGGPTAGLVTFMTSNDFVYPDRIATDAANNMYAVGTFRGDAAFGATTLLTGEAQREGYLAKASAAGSWQWAAHIDGQVDVRDIVTTPDGVSYVVGHFQGPTLTMGAVVVNDPDGDDGTSTAFVAKIGTAGTWQWGEAVGSSEQTRAEAAVLTTAGDVAVTGNFYPDMTVGGFSASAALNGSTDIYVATIDPDGDWTALTTADSPDAQHDVSDIASDADGNLIVLGDTWSGPAQFGAHTVTEGGFVAKLNAAGVWQWAVTLTETTDAGFYRLDTDAAGNSYLGGWIYGTDTVLGQPVTSPGCDILIVKIDSAGALVWMTQSTAADADTYSDTSGMVVDGSGNVYIAVYQDGVATYGTEQISPASNEMILVKLSTDGDFTWARATTTDSGFAYSIDVALDAQDRPLVGGSYQGTVTFGVTEETAVGSDGFIARYGTDGTAP